MAACTLAQGHGSEKAAGYTGLPADVAQLVEHFTRNEGVRGSNPRVGFKRVPAQRTIVLPSDRQ
jgi:hypothetical protein